MSKTITIKVCSKGCIVQSSETATVPGSPFPQPTTVQNEEPFTSDAEALKYVTEMIGTERGKTVASA